MSIAFPMTDDRCSLDSAGAQPAPRQRKPASPARIRANRENARRSTGPRTPEGKRRSGLNALKHGCCADTSHLPSECGATFALFVRDIEEELRPRTIMQRALFPRICNLMWRLRRVAEAQTKLFAHESAKAARGDDEDELEPCEVLARRFSDDRENGFILMERYERGMSNMLGRLMRQFRELQKQPPAEADEQVPRERAWDERKAEAQRQWFEEQERLGKSWSDLRDEHLAAEEAELAKPSQTKPAPNRIPDAPAGKSVDSASAPVTERSQSVALAAARTVENDASSFASPSTGRAQTRRLR